MRILESERNKFFSQDFIELTLTIGTVFKDSLVHNIPPLNTSFIAADNSRDMIFQPLLQHLRSNIIAILVNTEPGSKLRMPNQAMTNYIHSIVFTKFYEFIRLTEIVTVFLRMNGLALHTVLRNN